MRKPIIAGNWKMNHTLSSGTSLIQELVSCIQDFPHIDAIICPPAFLLEKAVHLTQNTALQVGAQNCHPEKNGAFTGEISAEMIADLQCKYCIIGHSERRQLFGETNHSVNLKVKAALKAGLVPILCVGETQEERDQNLTFSLIQTQLTEGLKDVSCDPTQLVIAYEPVWAIGTGNVATPEQAQDVHRFIRKSLASLFSESVSQAVRLQYGGSVNPENIASLISQPDIDGALVGGASLKSEAFLALLSQSQTYALG